MKSSATLLMKKLKELNFELQDIIKSNTENSFKNVNWDYDVDYSYENNQKSFKEIFEMERRIRNALNNFNLKTNVEGYDFTISEGLIRLAQLKEQIKSLKNLASKSKYFVTGRGYDKEDMMTLYEPSVVKEDLKMLQEELSKLQAAIDLTNLKSVITY